MIVSASPSSRSSRRAAATYALTYSLTGGLSVTPTGITGGTNIPLTVGGTLTPDELLRYPQLSGYTVLTLPPTYSFPVQTALRGQLAFSAVSSSGALTYATGIQIAGVLDDLYYYPGKLGVVFRHDDDHGWRDWSDDENCVVKLKLWAPTAQSVSLQIFNHDSDTTPAAVSPCTSTTESGSRAASLTGKTSTTSIASRYGCRPTVPSTPT